VELSREAFESFVTPVTESGCWIWNGTVNFRGYPSGYFNGKLRAAHRVSHELFNGPLIAGLEILHECDVKECVNPKHLRQGTHKENMQDAVKRGRTRTALAMAARKINRVKGEAHPRARLTEVQVREIFKTDLPISVLSRLCGISRQQIISIKRKKQWRHLCL
jgi:HNH endonuclease